MIQNKNIQIQNQISSSRSAFKPAIPQETSFVVKQSLGFNNSQKLNMNNSRQLSTASSFKNLSHDSELWSRAQIEKLFKLYDYYGSQWKVMSQHMPLRTANNLKNRFYTVLRNLIKLLFRKKSETCPKLQGEIPSKDLSRLYDGKQQYREFQSLVRMILQQLNYDLQNQKIQMVVRKYSQKIVSIYQVIYGERINSGGQQNRLNSRKTSQLSFQQPTAAFISNKSNEREDMSKLMGSQTKPRIGELPQQAQSSFYCIFFYNPAEFCPPQHP